VFEPVRKDSNLGRKQHNNKRLFDWWTVEKPLQWAPRDEGKRVSLNHDYGRRHSSGNKKFAHKMVYSMSDASLFKMKARKQLRQQKRRAVLPLSSTAFLIKSVMS